MHLIYIVLDFESGITCYPKMIAGDLIYQLFGIKRVIDVVLPPESL